MSHDAIKLLGFWLSKPTHLQKFELRVFTNVAYMYVWDRNRLCQKRLREKFVICNKTSNEKNPNICCKPSTYFWNIIRYYKKYIWEAKEPVMHSYFFFKWILFYHSTTHKKDSTKELTTSNNRLKFCIPWVLLPKIQNLINLCMLICIWMIEKNIAQYSVLAYDSIKYEIEFGAISY